MIPAFRATVVAARALAVWIIGVILHYTTRGKFGERLDPVCSTIQLLGFLVQVLGILIYTKTESESSRNSRDYMRLPSLVEEEEDGEEERSLEPGP